MHDGKSNQLPISLDYEWQGNSGRNAVRNPQRETAALARVYHCEPRAPAPERVYYWPGTTASAAWRLCERQQVLPTPPQLPVPSTAIARHLPPCSACMWVKIKDNNQVIGAAALIAVVLGTKNAYHMLCWNRQQVRDGVPAAVPRSNIRHKDASNKRPETMKRR